MATEPAIGTRIKRARERKRMSQDELAKELGVSRSAVNAWENDRAYPRSSIGALEEILGVSLTDVPDPARITPADEWERLVLEDQALPYPERADIVRRSRAARARLYPSLEPQSVSDDGRETGSGSRAAG